MFRSRCFFSIYSKCGSYISIVFSEFWIICFDFVCCIFWFDSSFEWRIFDLFVIIGYINGVVFWFGGVIGYFSGSVWFFFYFDFSMIWFFDFYINFFFGFRGFFGVNSECCWLYSKFSS